MLTAYFDDSGTHDEAEIMAMAGFIGTDEQWSGFDASWKAKLDAPLPDKPPLRRFHMADCEARSGEFSGYSKAEKDAVIHDFREIIIDNKLPGYVIAVERRASDELIVGPHAVFYGDCEQHCVRRCVSFALDYVRKHESERFCLQSRLTTAQLGELRGNKPSRTAFKNSTMTTRIFRTILKSLRFPLVRRH